jgi:hypothetical protein
MARQMEVSNTTAAAALVVVATGVCTLAYLGYKGVKATWCWARDKRAAKKVAATVTSNLTPGSMPSAVVAA